jgi:hypothetical protein
LTADIAEFDGALKANGYKLTIQRHAVLAAIIRNKEKHLSAKKYSLKSGKHVGDRARDCLSDPAGF